MAKKLDEASRIHKSSYFWNTVAGMLNAGQSAIVLIFISRNLPVEDAGLFTTAYAIAILLSTVGKYGLRMFQVTDSKKKFSFGDYLGTNILCLTVILFFSAVYLILGTGSGRYNFHEFRVIALMILFKLIDNIEDVYYGLYQQEGRLDIASKIFTLRLLISIVGWCVLITCGWSLEYTLIFSILISAIFLLGALKWSFPHFGIQVMKARWDAVKKLLHFCFPLCVSTSLNIYIGNAPKYMINQYMGNEIQAIFGYLMMPVFVITLLSNFIYQPVVKQLGDLWNSENYSRFKKIIMMQCVLIGIFTAIVVLGGLWVGLPVLSWLYNVPLSEYRSEFVLLLVGGGVYALATFLMVPITAMRMQKRIVWGYLLASMLGIGMGKFWINHYQLAGAAILYVIMNSILALFLFLILYINVRSVRNVAGSIIDRR